MSPRRPQARIYSHSPQTPAVQLCHADMVESNSGNYDLSTATVRSVVTLNHGELKELSTVAHQAQLLQIPTGEYDRAMLMLTPDQLQEHHQFHRQPLLLTAAHINQLEEDPRERVEQHIEQIPRIEHTQLITPIPEHMAKAEQEIPVYDQIGSIKFGSPAPTQLHGMIVDSSLSPWRTTTTSERPLILNAERVHAIDDFTNSIAHDLPENDIYRRRMSGFSYLRQVNHDPNANMRPIESLPGEIYETTMPISPNDGVHPNRTNVIHSYVPLNPTITERTKSPVIYDTIDNTFMDTMPRHDQASSSQFYSDPRVHDRASTTEVRSQIAPIYNEANTHIEEIEIEISKPLVYDEVDQPIRLRSHDNYIPLEQATSIPKKPIYNYGKLLVFNYFFIELFSMLIGIIFG